MVYPYHAVKGYYGKVALSRFKQLDGLKFLAPGDAKAIDWLKTNVTGQPTILEADGKSYTQYGRISMATGLPTVLGWFVHEWLWRGDYKLPDERVKDVSKLYCTVDPKVRRDLLKKYGIKYIIVGKLERTKFKWVKDREILKFGKVVFDADGTKIIQVNEGLAQNPTTRNASSQPFWVPVTKKAQGVFKPVTKPVQTRSSNPMQK